MLLTNRVILPFGHLLAGESYHWDRSLPIDMQIPFLPWTILIYFGVFGWWFLVYWNIANRDRRGADRFFCALLLAKTRRLMIFIFSPTSTTRPVLVGNTVWVDLLRLLYQFDTPDNLCPSIHCMLGWMCWIGIRGKRDVSPVVRFISLLLAVAVCLSTLTVKQHELVDVVGGILLSEICYMTAGLPDLRRLYSDIADCLIRGIFFRRKTEDQKKS